MDRSTKARIESLTHYLRSLAGGPIPPIDELARSYQLDPFVARRIAQAEGITLESSQDDEQADPRAPTGVISYRSLPKLDRDED